MIKIKKVVCSVSKDKVYIIGSTKLGKYLGYTYSKDEAKDFVKRHPDYTYKKINADTHMYKENGEELLRTFNGDTMFACDEECMLLGFDQFIIDVQRTYFPNLFGNLKYVRFSEDEKKYIIKLYEFIESFIQAYKEDLINEVEEEVYDYDSIIKWFIKTHGV